MAPTIRQRSRDALTSAKIGAIAAVSYTALFSFGAAIFKSGIGRGVMLAADWILSELAGGAVLTPRAHLRSLFGGPAVFGLSQAASTVALVVIAVVFTLLALARVKRQRA